MKQRQISHIFSKSNIKTVYPALDARTIGGEAMANLIYEESASM